METRSGRARPYAHEFEIRASGFRRPRKNHTFAICMTILAAVFFACVAIQCAMGPRELSAKNPEPNRVMASFDAVYR
jgi:hypothetical protein